MKHELSGGEYAQRRAQCETAAKILGVASLRDATAGALERARREMDLFVFRRARHVIGEIERTLQAADEIRKSNWPAVGRRMYASHYSLRDDFEVSCKELDAVVEICQSIGIQGGVYGCRMTGGGFGGSCVALVKADAVEAIAKQIATYYKIATAGNEAKNGIEATLFSSRPAAGAMVIKGYDTHADEFQFSGPSPSPLQPLVRPMGAGVTASRQAALAGAGGESRARAAARLRSQVLSVPGQ